MFRELDNVCETVAKKATGQKTSKRTSAEMAESAHPHSQNLPEQIYGRYVFSL